MELAHKTDRAWHLFYFFNNLKNLFKSFSDFHSLTKWILAIFMFILFSLLNLLSWFICFLLLFKSPPKESLFSPLANSEFWLYARHCSRHQNTTVSKIGGILLSWGSLRSIFVLSLKTIAECLGFIYHFDCLKPLSFLSSNKLEFIFIFFPSIFFYCLLLATLLMFYILLRINIFSF